ncbi:PQQ-dependent sugar dehydrogenase [Solicola gregarius]|uniref:PQQ-dependent sugar dehydrogenase n=1 Tax=Solicola gregarius TaxID=2908642 RepID=A0AA46TFV3_9ACTN|nr:PQQ-dependent sugar dehydrogenase [Solicola gregarius]UYM04099.1 PQQ-dependent sugar dehydrogenase [Solicola gregarius]
MRQWNMVVPIAAPSIAAALVLTLCPTAGNPSEGQRPAAPARPALQVTAVVRNLDIAWDLTFLPSKAMLYTERDRERIWWRGSSGRARVVARTPKGVWHGGETGLMSIEASPRFAENRTFYTCHGHRRGGTQDVRVVVWRLNKRATKARQVRPLVTGLPSTSGRHGGCQLAFGRHGRLYIGTGDAATGTNPQNLKSGGGKVLRVNARTGKGVASNPFAGADNAMKRRVYTYGHRNVQGLARRPGAGMWSVEHGTYRNDEVNRLRNGGDYGYNPVPGYNESVPMTDNGLPGRQISARWRSGNPTIAPSGAAWMRGKRWGKWQGALAMSVLGAEQLRILRFNGKGKLVGQAVPKRLRGTYGRLRAAVLGPGNSLYVTTANGGGKDRILRIRPRG